jgi:predicted TIM-barrel fold metal-dependent hydrolase
MQPPSFTPEELFKHTKLAGVDRVVLVQMSYYTPLRGGKKQEKLSGIGNGFDNDYMIHMIALHKGSFVGTAVIDPAGRAPDRVMTDLAKHQVRAFRIYPGLERGIRPNTATGERWLAAEGYSTMFAAAAKNNQAISCLINPDALPDLDRMCKKFPDTPVIIDHLCRIGVDGTIRDKDVDALCAMAGHKRVFVKVGAFYALGKKEPPYLDLEPLIRKVALAFGAKRCMWESDCPFQVDKHRYTDSLDLVRKHCKFLSDDEREWQLRRTAEELLFRTP